MFIVADCDVSLNVGSHNLLLYIIRSNFYYSWENWNIQYKIFQSDRRTWTEVVFPQFIPNNNKLRDRLKGFISLNLTALIGKMFNLTSPFRTGEDNDINIVIKMKNLLLFQSRARDFSAQGLLFFPLQS